MAAKKRFPMPQAAQLPGKMAQPSQTLQSASSFLDTINASGRPAAKRFSAAANVWKLYSKIINESMPEDARRARLRRIYDCASPYNPETLKARGLANQANLRFGMMTGIINARAGAVMEWALDTTNLVELRALSPEQAGPDAQKLATVIAEEYSRILRESPSFLPALSGSIRERDLYGLGPIGWPDKWDYQPMTLLRGQVKFPDTSPAVSAQCEVILVESELPNWYMVSLLNEPEYAKAQGWNPQAVEDYLKSVFLGGSNTDAQPGNDSGTSLAESQNRLEHEHRLYEVKQFDRLKVIHAYTRDLSGKGVTHQIIPANDRPDAFLFESVSAYPTMDSAVIWLPASTFEQHARALRGIASFLVKVTDLNDRLMCQVYDWLFREASIKVKSSAPGDRPKLTILEQGPYTVFGAEAESAPTQSAAGNIQQILGTVQATQGFSFASATGAAGPGAAPDIVFGGNSRRTQAEIEADGAGGKRYERSQMVAQVLTFDAVIRESFRRFMLLVNGDPVNHERYFGVADFIRRCERRGVDKKTLAQAAKLFTISLCRDLVLGGSGAKAASLTDFAKEFGGNIDEPGMRAITRDVASARFGALSADRYCPDESRDDKPSDSASLATVENNSLAALQPALAASEQLHWAHIPVHMQALVGIVRAFQAGQVEDAQHALDQLAALSKHIQEHAAMGGRQIGRADDAKAVARQLQSLRPVVQALTMQASAQRRHQEAMQEEQAKQQAELEQRAQGYEAQAAMHESDKKAEVKMREQDLLQQARLAGVEGKHKIALIEARHKAEIDRIRANAQAFAKAMPISGGTGPDLESNLPEPEEAAPEFPPGVGLPPPGVAPAEEL